MVGAQVVPGGGTRSPDRRAHAGPPHAENPCYQSFPEERTTGLEIATIGLESCRTARGSRHPHGTWSALRDIAPFADRGRCSREAAALTLALSETLRRNARSGLSHRYSIDPTASLCAESVGGVNSRYFSQSILIELLSPEVLIRMVTRE